MHSISNKIKISLKMTHNIFDIISFMQKWWQAESHKKIIKNLILY